MISKNYSPTKRKAISSIIGSFFFIVIMVAAFGAILTAMSLQSQLVEQQVVLSEDALRKFKEDFTVTPFCGPIDIGVHVLNRGTNEIEVMRVWYIEVEGPNYLAFPVDVDLPNRFVPPGGKVDVLLGEGIQWALLSPPEYRIKVVTELGNIGESTLLIPCSTGAPNPIEDQLVAKPAVYASFPNPIISTSEKSYYDISVVNPTKNPMQVYRASIQLISSTSPNTFGTGATTGVTGYPGDPANPSSGKWTSKADTIYWESNQGGITIPPFSIQAFPVYVQTSTVIQTINVNTINTNTLTSFGQFGSVKIDTLASYKGVDGNFAQPSIYLVSSSAPVPIIPYYTIEPPPPLATQFVYVVLENALGGASINASYTDAFPGSIPIDTTLVINVPAAFDIINPDEFRDTEFGVVPVVLGFEDGSKQIKYQLTTDIATGDRAIVGFSITRPTLSATAVYIFHMYAFGTTTDGTKTGLIGPVGEMGMKICLNDLLVC